MVRLQIKARGVRDPEVLAAMQKIPRHLFVPEDCERSAYEDRPLPIGRTDHLQPTSSPSRLNNSNSSPGTVLEVGAGSSYQAISLPNSQARSYRSSALKVWPIERGRTSPGRDHRRPRGRRRWHRGILRNPTMPSSSQRHHPGPAAPDRSAGGRRTADRSHRPQDCQDLIKLVKHEGRVERTSLGGVCFVPLIGQFGWRGEDP